MITSRVHQPLVHDPQPFSLLKDKDLEIISKIAKFKTTVQKNPTQLLTPKTLAQDLSKKHLKSSIESKASSAYTQGTKEMLKQLKMADQIDTFILKDTINSSEVGQGSNEKVIVQVPTASKENIGIGSLAQSQPDSPAAQESPRNEEATVGKLKLNLDQIIKDNSKLDVPKIDEKLSQQSKTPANGGTRQSLYTGRRKSMNLDDIDTKTKSPTSKQGGVSMGSPFKNERIKHLGGAGKDEDSQLASSNVASPTQLKQRGTFSFSLIGAHSINGFVGKM